MSSRSRRRAPGWSRSSDQRWCASVRHPSFAGVSGMHGLSCRRRAAGRVATCTGGRRRLGRADQEPDPDVAQSPIEALRPRCPGIGRALSSERRRIDRSSREACEVASRSARERRLDRFGERRIVGRDLGRPPGDQLSIRSDQVLGEVPGRRGPIRVGRARSLHSGRGVGADGGPLGERKADGVASRRRTQKSPRPASYSWSAKSPDGKPSTCRPRSSVAFVERLETLVLRRVVALAGGVDESGSAFRASDARSSLLPSSSWDLVGVEVGRLIELGRAARVHAQRRQDAHALSLSLAVLEVTGWAAPRPTPRPQNVDAGSPITTHRNGPNNSVR